MPVEIRELIIKTQITQSNPNVGHSLTEEEMQKIKQAVLADCLNYLKQQSPLKSASPFER